MGATLSSTKGPYEFTTQVANDGHNDIYVFADSYRPEVERVTARVRNVAYYAPHQVPYVAQLLGFTRIQPGYVVPFQPDLQLHKVVFVSVFSVEDSGYFGRVKEICDCYPTATDYSVVVGDDYKVHPVVHGKQWTEAGTVRKYFRHPY